MGRPRFAPKTREAVRTRAENPHGVGLCWHCGADLPGDWQIDHWPVRFSDIEGQVCCGQRDSRDPGNLVPACAGCNQSHRYESTAWCGASQCRCTHGAVMWVALSVVSFIGAAGWAVAAWLAWA
jgi:hypothetical protein